MKKLLVVCLGLLVFTACGDGSDDGGGAVAPITEKLETSLIKISDISTRDFGDIQRGTRYPLTFNITNKSPSDEMRLHFYKVRNQPSIDYEANCTSDPATDIIIQPAGQSCVVSGFFIVNTNEEDYGGAPYEGSPLVMYFKDVNNEELAVVIKFNMID